MLLNGHNLEIVKFAGSDNYLGFDLNTLQVASQGTSVTDGYFMVRVSGLPEKPKAKPIESFLLEASTTTIPIDGPFPPEMLAIFNRVEGKIIDPEVSIPKGIPKVIFRVRASLLLRAALSALMFAEGKDASLEIDIHSPKENVILRTENEQTGQQWMGLIMQTQDKGVVEQLTKNQKPEAHRESIKADAEVVDEFQAAIRAAELMGV